MTKILRMPFFKPKAKAFFCQVVFVLTLLATFCVIGGLEAFSISPLQAVTYILLGFLVMTVTGLKGGILRK